MTENSVKCDKWQSGVCSEIAAGLKIVVRCPRERAVHCLPGECCHHSLFLIRARLVEMKAGGVNLRRYRGKLKNAAFVERLYSAFLKVRKKRSSVSSTTSGKS